MTDQVMQILEDINGAQLVAWLCAITGVLIAVKKYGKRAVRIIRHVDRFMSEWYGEEPETDATGELVEPGKPSIRARILKLEELPERMDGMETKLEAVRGQVQNSHGTNFRDDVDGIRDGLGAMGNRLDGMGARLDGIESKLAGLGEDVAGSAIEVKEHIAIAKQVEARQDRDARRIADALAIRLNEQEE